MRITLALSLKELRLQVFENIPATRTPLDTNVGGFTAVALTKWALVTPVQVSPPYSRRSRSHRPLCLLSWSKSYSLHTHGSTRAQFVIGWSFHRGAWKALRRGTANMDVLVSLGGLLLLALQLSSAHTSAQASPAAGTMAAYIYSVASVIVHKVQWDQGLHTTSDDFFETSALLITFISCGTELQLDAAMTGLQASSAATLLQASCWSALPRARPRRCAVKPLLT